MTVEELWLRTLEEVVNGAAHEVKDALNGVSVNLEVVRSRSSRGASDGLAIGPFATAAADQLEVLTERTEALLYLARPAKGSTDVAVALRHLAALLVPTAKANGGQLSVEATQNSAVTSASAPATRLALAAGLLALIREGGGACRLDAGDGTVVRFSHESAGTCKLDPAVATAIAGDNIQIQRSDSDLVLLFPGNS
jgi:hypothetical protein